MELNRDNFHHAVEELKHWFLLPLAFIWREFLIAMTKKYISRLFVSSTKENIVSEKIEKELGTSGVDVAIEVDNSLNVSITASKVVSEGVFSGASAGLVIKAPLKMILDAAAAQTKNATIIGAESVLVTLLQNYEASKAVPAV